MLSRTAQQDLQWWVISELHKASCCELWRISFQLSEWLQESQAVPCPDTHGAGLVHKEHVAVGIMGVMRMLCTVSPNNLHLTGPSNLKYTVLAKWPRRLSRAEYSKLFDREIQDDTASKRIAYKIHMV